MKTVDWIQPLIEWLWNNKDNILFQEENNINHPGDRFGFDVYHPEYGGIPDKINKYLTNKHIDILNKNTVFYLKHFPDNKQHFCQKICDELTNSTIIFENITEFIKE